MGPAMAAMLGMNFAGGIAANQTNSAMNQQNLDFQYDMATNAHTYEVQDLYNAGLNPILSATGGSGARASGGSHIPVQNPAKDATSSALQAQIQEANISKVKAETSLLKAKVPTAEAVEEVKQDLIDAIKPQYETAKSYFGNKVKNDAAFAAAAKKMKKNMYGNNKKPKLKKKLTTKQINKMLEDKNKFLDRRNR